MRSRRAVAFISLAVVAALSYAAWLGYASYQDEKILDAARPAVKNVSLRITNNLTALVDGGNMTYKELFDRLESDVTETEKRILELQTLTTPRTKVGLDRIVEHLRTCQAALRAQSKAFRARLQMTNSLDSWERAVNRYRADSNEYSRQSMNDAQDAQRKAVVDARTAASDLRSALEDLKTSQSAMDGWVDIDGRVDSERIDKARSVLNETIERLTKAI
jgi:hypothetical protein